MHRAAPGRPGPPCVFCPAAAARTNCPAARLPPLVRRRGIFLPAPAIPPRQLDHWIIGVGRKDMPGGNRCQAQSAALARPWRAFATARCTRPAWQAPTGLSDSVDQALQVFQRPAAADSTARLPVHARATAQGQGQGQVDGTSGPDGMAIDTHDRLFVAHPSPGWGLGPEPVRRVRRHPHQPDRGHRHAIQDAQNARDAQAAAWAAASCGASACSSHCRTRASCSASYIAARRGK